MKACIYARYSTDQQSATSIEDQARVCRARASSIGLEVVAVHADQAVSGATRVVDRDGAAAMIEQALARRFDVLVVESLDRLSRDSVDLETTLRRLEHRGVRIIGVSDGYDSEAGDERFLTRGFRGLINEVYLRDLKKKTHRGLEGRVDRGFHAGGLSFGYRSVVAGVDDRGNSIGSRLEIVPEQADVVREIYVRYGRGESCQRIAADLNARGVRGPRGGTWSVSAIYGSPAKGAGILSNELYVGRYVWNRSQWTKDPDTKKRQRFERPRSEWRIEQHAELRIVDDDAWQTVRARMATPINGGGRKGRAGAPTTLFGGLLRCGRCGGAVVAIDAKDYGCASRKDRGASVCAGVRVRRRDIDALLLGHLKREVLAPGKIERIAELALAKARDAARVAERGASANRRRAAELQAEIGRLTDAIASVGISPALGDRLRRAEAALVATAAPTQGNALAFPLHARKAAEAAAGRLSNLLQERPARARDALRAAFGDIRLVPDGGTLYAEFESAAERLALAVGGTKMGRVAGACNLTRLAAGAVR